MKAVNSRFGSASALAVLAVTVGLGATAWGQSHGVSIGKSCLQERCTGDTVHCSIEIGHNDGFGDSITVLEAWDTMDPGGLNIRVPAVGNLPIASVSGNTNCMVGGSLPCDICAAGSALCPGALDPANQGFVVFLSDGYVIQPGDPDPLFNQANVRIRDNCNGCGAPPCPGCSMVPNLVGFGAATDILICEDNNLCTANLCTSGTETTPGMCEFDPECMTPSECDDLDLCTTDLCTAEGCCDAAPLCPPGEVCCADGTSCDDMDACTADICGPDGCCDNPPLCAPGEICCADGTSCDDMDACSVDACGLDGCCEYSPLCAPGEICCADGTSCDDMDACSVDACGVDGCCEYSPLCAPGETCCADGSSCDDMDACSVDSCGMDGCCDYSPLCGPGQVCCADGTACNDGNACTVDSCGPNGCCGSTPLCGPGEICCADGTSCDDGDPCTTDTCASGCCENLQIPGCGDIPTVSEWGVLVMALLLAIGGKVYFGRGRFVGETA